MENLKTTTLINLFGAPSTGKSTLAAQLYADLKKEGKSVELVREAIKKWAWAGKVPTIFEQHYIVNEQMKEETSLYGKVDYLISDSPILLGAFYCEYYTQNDLLCDLDYYVHNIWGKNQIKKVSNFLLKRDKSIEFENNGRYSNNDESEFIGHKLENFLKEKDIKYINIDNNINERISLIKMNL